MVTIAFSGKGRVGKTTLAALLIKYFLDQHKLVLAVDADPNSNLDSKLGIKTTGTIGALREEIMKNINNIPQGVSKSEWLEYKIKLAITEAHGFDLFTMGRSEGAGCYCYINQVLRALLDKISEQYDYVVIDCEAGMEHLSRRTTRNIDTLVIVSDYTKEGILTASRIKKLALELELKIKNLRLAVNFAKPDLSQVLKGTITKVGFELKNIVLIPYDKQIANYSLEDYPVINISTNSKAYNAITELANKVNYFNFLRGVENGNKY
jgi:CO dehydrogenase maturation factor